MFYNDSRDAAIKIYRKLRLNWLFNTSTFIGNLVIALTVTYFFSQLGHGEAVNYVFLLTVLAIGLWVTEAIPPFAVGIFMIGMLVFGFGTDFILSENKEVDIYIDTWTSNVIWLLLGGFFLAEAMKQVSLDRSLFNFTIKRFGSRADRLLLGLMFMTALASMIMSNTATTAMMISSVIPLVRSLGKESPYSKALMIGIPAAASVGGIGTIIGSTPNAIAVGALGEVGIQITFVEWMMIGFPLAILLVYLFAAFLIRTNNIKHLDIDLSVISSGKEDENKGKRKWVIFTLIVTVGLWLTEPLHGIPVAATSGVPILFLTLTRVIDSQQVRALPWDTLMLVAGGLAMGIALVEVGLAKIVMDSIYGLNLSIFALVVIFAMIGVLFSNVMSNTAASSILIPLSISLPEPYNIAVPIIVAISCSCSLLLPVSTPSNAIAYATGLIEQKDFRAGGIFFIIAGPVGAISTVMIWTFFYF